VLIRNGKIAGKTKATKKPSGSLDVALVCQVRWNDSKVVTIATTCVGAKPLQKADIHPKKREGSRSS